ncbi:MAG: sodium:solute symporter [Proteobacteria bacterium]|nr:sodium:solute symporter [Pseudomonadota bacterium]
MAWLDAATAGLYAALVLGIGWASVRRGGDARELQLGGRALPAWAVLCSMVATELSAATFIGVPQAAFAGDWSYLQFAFGALAGKLVIAAVVVPRYHARGVVTVYGWLSDRYGPHTRRAAAATFALGRIAASGARLFIAALALSVATGWPLEAAIAVCGVLAAAYTIVGGIRAVVWTDVLQAFVFVTAAGVALWVASGSDPGCWGGACEAGRTRVFHWEPLLSLTQTNLFGVALAGGFFLTLATHATDHDMVQRLLCTRSARGGSRALVGSALLNFPLTALFLALGTALACFYAQPGAPALDDSARVVPAFALEALPAGARGLLFAGLFAAAMSSLDSAICAIATTAVVDLWPHDDPAGAAHRMRRTSAVVALLLVAAALGMASYHRLLSDAGTGLSLVELALSAMTLVYGGLLAVFALGFASRTPLGDRAGLAGLATGVVLGTGLFLHPVLLGETLVAWPWWIPLAGLGAAGVAGATHWASRP